MPAYAGVDERLISSFPRQTFSANAIQDLLHHHQDSNQADPGRGPRRGRGGRASRVRRSPADRSRREDAAHMLLYVPRWPSCSDAGVRAALGGWRQPSCSVGRAPAARSSAQRLARRPPLDRPLSRLGDPLQRLDKFLDVGHPALEEVADPRPLAIARSRTRPRRRPTDKDPVAQMLLSDVARLNGLGLYVGASGYRPLQPGASREPRSAAGCCHRPAQRHRSRALEKAAQTLHARRTSSSAKTTRNPLMSITFPPS